MPSTWVALKIASQPISAARSAAVVSVVKNGLPVPPTKTSGPSAKWARARARMNGSQMLIMGMADITRADRPLALERLSERQAVQHRGEHAHIVAAHPVHAVGGGSEAAIDVAAADHEAKLDAEARGLAFAGDAVQHVHVDAVAVLCPSGPRRKA